MEALILATLESDLTKDSTDGGKSHLVVDQIRILNEDGNNKLIYPSRTDLAFDKRVTVVRT